MVNQGTMRASNGGTLVLSGFNTGSFDNTGGTVEALNGSSVQLINSAFVQGGDLAAFGAGQFVVASGHSATLNTLATSGTVLLTDNSNLNLIGTIDNSGNIRLTSGGNNTDLRIDNTTATLTGGGSVTMEHVAARFVDENGSPNGSLVNVDNLIQGLGNIGSGELAVVNQGTIRANVAGGGLRIDPRVGTTMQNEGLMEAVGAGILVLDGVNGGDFLNTGTIAARDDSLVQLVNNAIVTGGTLETNGTGEFRVVSGQTAFLTDLSLDGVLRSEDNTNLQIAGTIENLGTIILESGGNSTDLRVDNTTATLTGGGTIVMNHPAVRILDEVGSPNGTLVNEDNTIQGVGNVGAGQLVLVNGAAGVIEANVLNGTLTIDQMTGSSMINNGLLRARNGGTLTLTGAGGGDFDNTNGTIEALDQSFVRLVSLAEVTGGLLQTSGSGEFRVSSGQTALLADLSLAGVLRLEDNSDLQLIGTIANSGSIHLESGGNNTDIRIHFGTTTLTGGGTIFMNHPLTRILDEIGSPDGTLVIEDQTIRGVGNVGGNQVVLQTGAAGVIHADRAGTLVVDPFLALTNDGTLRASSFGTLLLTGSGGGSFSGTGTVEALNSGVVQFDSSAVVLNVDATGTLTSGTWRAIDDGQGATVVIQNNATSTISTIGSGAAVELRGTNSAFSVHGVAIDSTLATNHGSLTLGNGRVMNTSGGLTTTGLVTVDGSGTHLNVNGNYVQTGGSAATTLIGGAAISASLFQIGGGSVAGNGDLNGDANFAEPTLIAPGLSAGIINIAGATTLAGELDMEIAADLVDGIAQDLAIVNRGTDPAGMGFDQINIFDSASLDGLMEISFIDGYTPVVGDTFDLITANDLSVAGTFAVVGTGVATFDFNVERLFDPLSGFDRDVLRVSIVSVVPEPGSLFLLLIGCGGGWVVRRRRRV
jgi:hypothetical protein